MQHTIGLTRPVSRRKEAACPRSPEPVRSAALVLAGRIGMRLDLGTARGYAKRRSNLNTSLDALKAVPYLAVEHIGDRTVNLMPLWDGDQWHSWFLTPKGFCKLQMHDLAQGEYLAQKAADDSDVYVRFLEFAWQRASWPEAFALWRHITDDVHNLATSVAKLEYFFAYRVAAGNGVCAFVQTELEYMVVLARSMFDLLQELIARVWSRRVRLLDAAAEAHRKAHPLPAAFSKVVLRHKEQLRTAEQIVADFGVGPALGAAYASTAPFFSSLRDVRDGIVHGGKALDMIFLTEKGFCVHRSLSVLTKLGGWSVQHRYSDNLVSLLPLVAHVVCGSIGACDAVIDALATEVQFPPELAPGYRVFVRSYHNDALLRLIRVHEGGSPWSGDVETAG